MKKQSRRQFLQGLGGFTLSLPFLPSLLPSAAGQTLSAMPPKRFIAWATHDGYMEPVFYPSVEPDIRLADDIYYKKLADIDGPISRAFGNLLDPYRSKMNIYRGLDIITGVGFGHGIGHMLTAARRIQYGDSRPNEAIGTSISMDNVLRRSKSFYPTPPTLDAIRCTGWVKNGTFSYDRDAEGNWISLPHAINAEQLFAQVFKLDVKDPEAASKLATNRISIGDLVLEDFKRKMNDRRIAAADKTLLSEYVDEVHQLYQRIKANAGKVCTEPEVSDLPTYYKYFTDEQRIQMYHEHIDIIVAAFKCDISRIALVHQKRDYFSDHGNSHRNPYSDLAQSIYITNTQGMLTNLMGYMLSRLDSEVEANGKTMLDNSILFWGSDISEGYAHSKESMPAVSFGSAAGAINTGYYVDYRQRPFYHTASQEKEPAIGRSYTQLLITFMKALGLPPEDYLKYGDGNGFGSFSTAHPEVGPRYKPYEKFRNDPLPLIWKA